MTDGRTFGASRALELPSDWFEEQKNNPNAVYWIVPPPGTAYGQNTGNVRTPPVRFQNFKPLSIVFDGDNNNEDNAVASEGHLDRDATWATVRGILFEDNSQTICKRALNTHQNHPRCYAAIYPYGTTARGIEINA